MGCRRYGEQNGSLLVFICYPMLLDPQSNCDSVCNKCNKQLGNNGGFYSFSMMVSDSFFENPSNKPLTAFRSGEMPDQTT